MIKSKFEIGQGIYQISDLSQILNVPGQTVRRIVNEYWDKRIGEKSNIRYSWGDHRDKYVNFHSLIEFYTFHQLRMNGVKMKAILTAHDVLSRHFDTPYPFATHEILSSGGEILFKYEGGLIEADEGKQIHLKQVIEPFCKKIDFSGTQAARFWPLGKRNFVVVDPKHQFGQPTIYGTNIKAETLWSLYKAGENEKFIAALYEITIKKVVDAINFYERKVA